MGSMNEWCVNQHGKSGLTAACIASAHTYEEVTRRVLDYIQRWVPEKGASLLAGSSVHADMRCVRACGRAGVPLSHRAHT